MTDGGLCLNLVGGGWDYEPTPSSRTDKWLAKHRFDNFAAAWKAAETCDLNPGFVERK